MDEGQFEGVDWGQQRLVEGHAVDGGAGVITLTSDGNGLFFAYLIVVGDNMEADADNTLIVRLEPEEVDDYWAKLKAIALEDA